MYTKPEDNPSWYVPTHGLWGTRVYNAWKNMLSRCTNPHDKDYHRYGGRGILVCEEWQQNVFAFIDDMGEPPEGMTLGRLDNDGNYTKVNCEWQTVLAQNTNKSDTKMITINGVTMCMKHWNEAAGHGYNTVGYRVRVSKMSPIDAIYKNCSDAFLIKYPRKDSDERQKS